MVSNDKNEEHDPLDFMFLSKEDEECDSSIIGKTAADSTEITHHGLFPMPHYPVLAENIHSTNQSNVQDIHGVSGFLTTTDLSPQSNTLSNHLVAQDSIQHEKALSLSPESRLPMPFPSLIQKQIPRTNKSDNMGIPLSGSVLKEDSIHSNTLLCSPIVENSPHVEGNISNLPKAVRFYSYPADNSNAAHQYMNATHSMASFDNSVANLNTFPNYKINGNFTAVEHNEGRRLQMTRPLGEDNSNIYEHLIGSNFINPTERIPVSHHSPTSGDIATAKNGVAGAVQVDYANKLHGSILAHGTAGRTVKHTPNANIFDRITGNLGNIYPNSHVQLESTSSLNHACGFSDYSSSQGTGFSRIAHSIGEGDQNSCKGRGKMALGKVRNVESGNMEIYPSASPIPYSSNPIWQSEVSEGLNFTPQQIYGQLQNWNAQKNLNTLPQTSVPSKFDGTEGRTTRNLAGRGSLTLGKRRNIESGKIATPPSASLRPYSSNPVRLAESTKGLKFAPQQSSGQLQNWNEHVNILPQSSQFDGVTGNTATNEGLGKLGRPLDSVPHPSPGKPRPSFVSGLIFPSARNSGLVHGSNAFSGASPNVRQYNRNFLSSMDPLGPRPSPGPGMPIAKGSEIAQTFNGFDGPAVKRRTIRPPPAVRCSQRRNTTFIPSADTSNQFSPQTRLCLPMQSQNQALSIRMKPPVPTVPPSLINPINSPTPVAHIQWKGPRETPQLKGQNCPCCKRDLSCTPDGPLYLSTGPPVAVLPCGHVFHDHCLELITPQDQSHDPMCILCAIGEPLN